MNIDRKLALPLHAQLEEVLFGRIRDGDLPAASRLPSEDELISRYAVSRTTVRTAIKSLMGQGMVEIRRGKGTFVTTPVMTQELTALTGFIGDMHPPGKEPSAKLLDRRLVAASETVSRQLAVHRGATVARIQRVHLAEGVPLSFDETYLPQQAGATPLGEDLEKQPIMAFEAEYRLAAVASHGTVARALSIDGGSPIFLIERTRFSDHRRPLDYQRLYYRGDHIRFVTRLTRSQSTVSPRVFA
jgi:GntR family transcriptional regulator